MRPKKLLSKFAANVTKRCGICQATVEQVLPAVFDEIRYQLCEGRYRYVPIESFGIFVIKNVPRRMYHNTRNGKDEWKLLEPKKVIKFAPTRNFTTEVGADTFDPTRQSFVHHNGDPAMRRRIDMQHKPVKGEIPKSQTTYFKESPLPTSPKGAEEGKPEE